MHRSFLYDLRTWVGQKASRCYIYSVHGSALRNFLFSSVLLVFNYDLLRLGLKVYRVLVLAWLSSSKTDLEKSFNSVGSRGLVGLTLADVGLVADFRWPCGEAWLGLRGNAEFGGQPMLGAKAPWPDPNQSPSLSKLGSAWLWGDALAFRLKCSHSPLALSSELSLDALWGRLGCGFRHQVMWTSRLLTGPFGSSWV